MIMGVGLLSISLLTLFLLDRLTGFGQAWFGEYRWFAMYHAALLFTSALMLDRMFGKTPPEWVYSLFIAVAVGGIIWAGLLGRALERRDQ